MDSQASLKARILDLPVELQRMVVGWKVLKNGPISLSSPYQEVAQLILPFAGDVHLFDMARSEVYRMNKFSIIASDTTVVHDSNGVPNLRFASTGTTFTPEDGKKFKKIDVVLSIVLTGCDWNQPSPVTMDQSTVALLAALPVSFPELESIYFKASNLGLVASPNATYTRGFRTRLAKDCPVFRHRERSARVFQLARAIHGSTFPAWRRGRRVEKKLLLVQGMSHAKTGPTQYLNLGARSFSQTSDGTRSRGTWQLWDWPRVIFTFR